MPKTTLQIVYFLFAKEHCLGSAQGNMSARCTCHHAVSSSSPGNLPAHPGFYLRDTESSPVQQDSHPGTETCVAYDGQARGTHGNQICISRIGAGIDSPILRLLASPGPGFGFLPQGWLFLKENSRR